MTALAPWPPSARHYHGFDRAVILFRPSCALDEPEHYFPVGMVDGQMSHLARQGLWDQRNKEWYDWWTSDPDRESHSCRPTWRCILASWAEVVVLAEQEGVELPPWITPLPT